MFENIALGINPKLKLTTEQKQRVIECAKQVGIDSYLERLPEHFEAFLEFYAHFLFPQIYSGCISDSEFT